MTGPFRAGLFEGQRALITGGGSGIGLATARLLGGLGAQVAICGRTPEKLEKAAELLRSEGVTCRYEPVDIRQAQSVSDFVDRVVGAWGGLDLLVNNAGGQFPTPAEKCSPRGFEAVVRNNLLGTWNVTHAVANAAFIPQRGGAIVNVIAQVLRGFPGMVHTGAARAGVDNMTKTLSVEWAKYGVRVNAIAPGVIFTSGTKQYGTMLLEAGRKATPMKRLGTEQEIAEILVFLLSESASFVTGQTWYADGGQSLAGDLFQLSDDVPTAQPLPE